MTVTNWTTTVIDGKDFLVIDVAKFRVPLEWDPSSNMFIAVAAPDGGIGNFPALVKGDDGATPALDTAINFTPMAYNDASPEFASWTETAPNVYKLNLGLKSGAPGANGSMVLTPTDYGTPVAGRLLRVKPDLTGFEYVAPKTGNRYLPALVASVPTGNPAYTVCAVPIDAKPFDYYPRCEGQTVVTGTGSDVRVDLFARLSTTGVINGETAGPVVARAFGQIGANTSGIATVLSGARPAGIAASYGKVLAGNTAVVYLRTERQAGANTYSTDDDTTLFEVWTDPVE